jgi:hypothetical protein
MKMSWASYRGHRRPRAAARLRRVGASATTGT